MVFTSINYKFHTLRLISLQFFRTPSLLIRTLCIFVHSGNQVLRMFESPKPRTSKNQHITFLRSVEQIRDTPTGWPPQWSNKLSKRFTLPPQWWRRKIYIWIASLNISQTRSDSLVPIVRQFPSCNILPNKHIFLFLCKMILNEYGNLVQFGNLTKWVEHVEHHSHNQRSLVL